MGVALAATLLWCGYGLPGGPAHVGAPVVFRSTPAQEDGEGDGSRDAGDSARPVTAATHHAEGEPGTVVPRGARDRTAGAPRAREAPRSETGVDRPERDAPWIEASSAPAVREDGPLFLLALEPGESEPGTRVIGFDARGPRDLVLWEVSLDDRRAAQLGTASSRADGLILAEQLLLPARAFGLVVAPAGDDPFGPAASATLDVAASPIAPPFAWLEPSNDSASGERAALSVAVVGGGFTLVVGDADGRDLEAFSVPEPALARRSRRVLRFFADADARQVARMLPDGRRSAWTSLQAAHDEVDH